jgi:hypothetical protein
MKELLTEFLATILNEARIKAVKVDDGDERIVYFGSKEAAQAAIDASTHRPYLPTDKNLPSTKPTKLQQPDFVRPAGTQQKPIGSDIPKGILGKKAKPPTRTPGTRAQNKPSLRSKLVSSLVAIAKTFQDRIYSGQGQSIGTKSSTQGEHSSCTSTQDFISGRVLSIDGQNVPIPAGVTNGEIEVEKQIIANGRGGKKLSPYELTNRAIESAWIVREQQRYVNSGNEPPEEDWLKYAYRSGLSSAAALRQTPEYNADLIATTTAIQSGELPPPMVMNAENRNSTIQYLKSSLENSSSDEDKSHYQMLLTAMDVAEDTDTVVHFINKNGQTDALLVSNKKSKNDPHGNTTPIARIKKLREVLSQDPQVASEISQVLQAAQDIIKKGGDSVSVSKEYFLGMTEEEKQSAAEILKERFKVLKADRGRTKDYTDDIVASRPIQIALKDMYCTENPDDCRKGKPLGQIPPEYTQENVGRAFIRAVESSEGSPDILTKILGKVGDASTEDDRALLGPVIDSGLQTRKAAKDAHDLIVSSLVAADERICKADPQKCREETGNSINGPATQAYIQSFMQDTHWDQYICNTDDCSRQDAISARKMVDMDGKKVTPKRFRECLAKISKFKGDANSHDGQRGLWQHLQRTLVTRAGEDSISIREGDGVRKIGKETYRTKGAVSSLLTFLGKDMTDCVTQ